MGIDLKSTVKTARSLPSAVNDGLDVDVRGSRYGEPAVMTPVRKQHLLADEGSYYVTNNAQSGIATGTSASFSATAALCVITNSDSVDDTNSRRIYLDYMTLVTTAAGGWSSAGVNTQLALYLSMSDRYASGGTDLSANIVSTNSSVGRRDSVAQIRFGAVTATATVGSDRAICGLRILRPAVSTTVADVVGETKTLNFGGVEASLNGSITVANANMISLPLPPIVIGPGHSAVIYYIMNGTTASAASFAPEIGWWER